MTHEQQWAFYKLLPKLMDQFAITSRDDGEYVDEIEVAQAILDIAAEDGVSINADAACETCAQEEAADGRVP